MLGLCLCIYVCLNKKSNFILTLRPYLKVIWEYISSLNDEWKVFITNVCLCFCDCQIEQQKQELNRKEADMQALQTKLETLTNQNSDCKQHIEVLKESLSAKEQRANTLQTEVST